MPSVAPQEALWYVHFFFKGKWPIVIETLKNCWEGKFSFDLIKKTL